MAEEDISFFLVCWGMDENLFLDIPSGENNNTGISPENILQNNYFSKEMMGI